MFYKPSTIIRKKPIQKEFRKEISTTNDQNYFHFRNFFPYNEHKATSQDFISYPISPSQHLNSMCCISSEKKVSTVKFEDIIFQKLIDKSQEAYINVFDWETFLNKGSPTDRQTKEKIFLALHKDNFPIFNNSEEINLNQLMVQASTPFFNYEQLQDYSDKLN